MYEIVYRLVTQDTIEPVLQALRAPGIPRPWYMGREQRWVGELVGVRTAPVDEETGAVILQIELAGGEPSRAKE